MPQPSLRYLTESKLVEISRYTGKIVERNRKSKLLEAQNSQQTGMLSWNTLSEDGCSAEGVFISQLKELTLVCHHITERGKRSQASKTLRGRDPFCFKMHGGCRTGAVEQGIQGSGLLLGKLQSGQERGDSKLGIERT